MGANWILVGWLLCGMTPAISANGGEVRPLQQRGKLLLAKGIRLSMTFRRLTDEIRRSNVVVYVDLDPYSGRKFDGVLEFVGNGGGSRFVKVWLRPGRSDDEILITFGHELQHAVEVAQAAQVVSATTFAAFYRDAGRSDNPGLFETQAAQDIAARIRAELSGPHATQRAPQPRP